MCTVKTMNYLENIDKILTWDMTTLSKHSKVVDAKLLNVIDDVEQLQLQAARHILLSCIGKLAIKEEEESRKVGIFRAKSPLRSKR